MLRSTTVHSRLSGKDVWIALAAFIVALPLTFAATRSQAQTLTVLHSFTGGADGSNPMAGLTGDSAGNLYGTTTYGGGGGNCEFGQCGVVFRVTHRGSSWVETPIYTFKGLPDGAGPIARVIFGPDGALYGTTPAGGTLCGGFGGGCGTVFKIQPPPTFCASTLCPWRETILYSFTSSADGLLPEAGVTFDSAGNLYGTTRSGGSGPCNYGSYSGCGTVFKLTPNRDGTWSKSTLYSFQGGANDGISPYTEVLFDQAGKMYGTTEFGAGTGCELNNGCGIVFELTPSGSGWTETVLHIFTNGSDGAYPGALTFDNQGNLYGVGAGPGEFGPGLIFELTPTQNGGWNFSVPYTFAAGQVLGPGPLAFDTNGNILGTSSEAGPFGGGNVYKLTPSSGGWTFTNLYNFGSGDDSEGFFPVGKVVLDNQGNIYGVNYEGPYPSPDVGAVWEITP